IAVSNLEALARCGTARVRGAVIDARRGEICGAGYYDAGHIGSPEVVLLLDTLLRALPAGVDHFRFAGPTPAGGGVRGAGGARGIGCFRTLVLACAACAATQCSQPS